MKNYFIPLLFSIILFNSCEDPIDVTLEEADPQIVVDAWLTNIPGLQEIKLTTTQPYFDNTLAEGLDNASVVVTSSNGSVLNFIGQGNGSYTYDLAPGTTLGQTDDQFTLNVEVNGLSLTSSAALYRVPVLDSIMQEFRDDEPFLDDGIYCQFFSRDLIGLGDTYWIKSYKNDTFLNRASEINIAFDAGFDAGGEVDGLVFITPIREAINANDDDNIPTSWNPGDKSRVEIHSISNSAFAFLEITRDQLLNSQSGIFAAPLANTKGNIVNETNDEIILGVFNISEVSSAEITIE